MKRLLKAVGLSLMASIPVTLASLPVLAESFDDVFASRVSISRDWLYNWTVQFAPTKNSYSYQIQIAGKKASGELACNQFAASQLKKLEWNKIKAEIGLENKNINAYLYGEGELVPIYGAYIGRNYVQSAIHIRVVAINQRGNEVFKTNWEGGNDIKYWGWQNVPNCGYVAD